MFQRVYLILPNRIALFKLSYITLNLLKKSGLHDYDTIKCQ